VNAACEDYLPEMAHVDTIYLDPSRRDEHGRRVVSLADCRPNVVELLPLLRSKSSRIIIKLSPMLDHRLAAREVDGVSEIHIVSVGGECKELLLVLDKERAGGDCRVICVNDDERLEFAEGEEAQDVALWDGRAEGDGLYIYEPNASIMKAGATELLASKFNAMVVSRDSHLIVSGSALPHFPGRGFVLRGVSTMNKKEIKSNLGGITRANVSVRNFPMRADELSKRLKVTDGGEDYIFGTRLADGKSVLLFSRKI
ncbi:MAG: SAM-dependent methyltransferase, partial [Muribaculaceae bacterium]|nr:SAM-dependent methyltransferase [Muribaculaceae bacterium]